MTYNCIFYFSLNISPVTTMLLGHHKIWEWFQIIVHIQIHNFRSNWSQLISWSIDHNWSIDQLINWSIDPIDNMHETSKLKRTEGIKHFTHFMLFIRHSLYIPSVKFVIKFSYFTIETNKNNVQLFREIIWLYPCPGGYRNSLYLLGTANVYMHAMKILQTSFACDICSSLSTSIIRIRMRKPSLERYHPIEWIEIRDQFPVLHNISL